jgi:hypothetical protein
MLIAAACATAGSSGLGTIAIKSGANASARPVTFSVGKGTISSSDMQAWVDRDCIHGTVGRTPIDFCRDPNNPNLWAGSSGEFFVDPPDKGARLMPVRGHFTVEAGRDYGMTQQVDVGDGPQWDELRRNPALLAIAATAADLQAARVRH